MGRGIGRQVEIFRDGRERERGQRGEEKKMEEEKEDPDFTWL